MKRVTLGIFIVLSIVFTASIVSCGGGKADDKDTTKDSGGCEKDTVAADSVAVEGEWIVLFGGAPGDTTKWKGYQKPGFPQIAWQVTPEGELHMKGSGNDEAGGKGGDIITEEAFENFELELEWKISEGGNSGIFFMVIDDPEARIFHSAPEMQVLDDNGHPDANKEDQLGRKSHRAGSLYDLIPAPDGAFTGAGEWQKAYIKKNGDHVIFKLNGVTTAEFTLWDDTWNEMVKNSKFSQWDLFGTNKGAGHIGLQDHGDDVWFRNIRIKKL